MTDGTPSIEDIKKFAQFLGMGFYIVKESGEFVEADPIACDLFGLPTDETDISRYNITDLYAFPAKRKLRVKKLRDAGSTPISSTLSLRIKGENKLFFNRGWCLIEGSTRDKIASLITEIEDRVIFPKMFEDFPMAVFQLDDESRFVYLNKKVPEILGFQKKEDIIGKSIKEFYAEEKDLEQFNNAVADQGHAHDIIKFQNSENKIIEVESFATHINEFKIACWGMFHDVTKRERYIRALDKMPTGYYYTLYNEGEETKHKGRITQCNDQFAWILGVRNKEKELIGKDVEIFYADQVEKEEYFNRLEQAARGNKPVLNYPFTFKRADNGKIVHVSVDAHLIKDQGKIIGREGTIRDISTQVELQERLHKITADINSFIHTFMRPLLKFSGHAELFTKSGKLLFKSIRHKAPEAPLLKKTVIELKNKVDAIIKGLGENADGSKSAAALLPKFKTMRNVYHYNLAQVEDSSLLLDNAIRNMALWILEELENIGYLDRSISKGKLWEVIPQDFIKYLQDIILGYLIRTAGILKGETVAMKHEVETIRRYIGFGMKRIYNFRKQNLTAIIEENIESFKPVLAQKDIEIEYSPGDDIYAEISANDIDRVISNLLQNVNKYSRPGPGRIVKIKVREIERDDDIEFKIESFGIPIKKEELDSGKIFEVGYRSELAYKTDRDGTGVGLADAKEVIEAHHAEITITSRPTRDDGDPPKYKVPYVTTVSVKLPKTQEKRRNKNE